MRKILTTIVIGMVMFTNITVAKENSNGIKELKETLEKYKQISMSGDMIGTIDYIYPPVFKLASKETLKEQFKMVKDAGKMPKVKEFNYSLENPIKTYKNGIYSIINYTMKMTMDIKPPVKKENKAEYAKVQEMLTNPEKLKAYKDFTIKMLKMQMGDKSKISSDTQSTVLNIEKPSILIAINEKKDGWKFVEPVPAALAQLKPLLPKEIVDNEKEIFNVKTLSPQEQFEAMMKMVNKEKK